MRFHARFHPVSTVSHACHQKSMQAQWFHTPATQKMMAMQPAAHQDIPLENDAFRAKPTLPTGGAGLALAL